MLALCDKNLFLLVLESRKFKIKALVDLAFVEGSLALKMVYVVFSSRDVCCSSYSRSMKDHVTS